MTATDGLVGVVGAVVVGSLLAVRGRDRLIAARPARSGALVHPSPGIAFDWTVLGFGALVLIVALGGIALAIAYRLIDPAWPVVANASDNGLVLLRRPRRRGCPWPSVTGIRFALDPGAVAVRSRCVPRSSALRWRSS